MSSIYSPENGSKRLAEDGAVFNTQMQQLMFVMGRHIEKIAQDHGQRMNAAWSAMQPMLAEIQQAASQGRLPDLARDYAADAAQRFALTLDVCASAPTTNRA